MALPHSEILRVSVLPAKPYLTSSLWNDSFAQADANFAYLEFGKANLASPTFTDIPRVPTAAVGVNTTQAASTAFVQAQLAALQGALAVPLTALPFPHIATDTNFLAVASNALAGTGGTVSVAAGTVISLGQAITAAIGIMGAWTTAEWTSPTLAASTIYYLRAQVVAGAFTLYVQKGADSDEFAALPAGLVGAVNGTSGGGFNSTPLDILLARVVTGVTGAAPTVTALKNSAIMSAVLSVAWDSTSLWGWNAWAPGTLTLNWARTPRIYTANLAWSNVGGGTWGNDGTGTASTRGIKITAASRYAITTSITAADTDGSGLSVNAELSALG